MSITFALIPVALAAAAAVGGAGVGGTLSTRSKGGRAAPVGRELTVQTRMKDANLLGHALEDLGAQRVRVEDETISAQIDGIGLQMTRDADQVWQAHFTALDGRTVTEVEGSELIGHLDAAYARRVQHAVAERIRTRAEDAGFDLVSETREADDTVTMVLHVREGA